jgi:hypothetical protein
MGGSACVGRACAATLLGLLLIGVIANDGAMASLDEECGPASEYAAARGDSRAQYNLGICALSAALALDAGEGDPSDGLGEGCALSAACPTFELGCMHNE